MDSFKVQDQDQIEVYEEQELVLRIPGKELKEMAPEWSGEVGVGDIATVNDEKRRIVKLGVDIPNSGETVTKYKVFID